MLFMVIETLQDIDAVGARFREKGRMLTEGVTYVASWGELDGGRWFQLMEASEKLRWLAGRNTGTILRLLRFNPW